MSAPPPSSGMILAPGVWAGAASWGLVSESRSLARGVGDYSEALVRFQIFGAPSIGGLNESSGEHGRRDTPAPPQDSWHHN